MTAITPISALASTVADGLGGLSGSLTAADLAALQGGGKGGFAGLFAALLAAGSDTDIAPELSQELPVDFLASQLLQPQLTVASAGIEVSTGIEELTEGALPQLASPLMPEMFLPETPLSDAPLPDMPLPETLLPETLLPQPPLPKTPLPETLLPEASLPEAPLLEMPLPEILQPETPLPEMPLPKAIQPAAHLPEVPLSKVLQPETPQEILLPEASLAEALVQLLQPALSEKGEKEPDKNIPEVSEESLIALGALATPVESVETVLPTALEVSGKATASLPPAAPPLTPQKAEKEELPLSPAKPTAVLTDKALPPTANLAGKSDGHSSGGQEEKQDFNQFLREAATLSTSKAGNPDAPRATATLSTPVTSRAWGERLGEQIIWMTKNGQQQVELKLHPANLGPLSISLNMNGDKATINFTVATMEVRQAIEEALPRLREMMSAAGVSLGEADVDEQTRRETSAHDMTGRHGAKDQNPARQNDEFAENSGESPDANEPHDRNAERASILADMVNGHATPFAYSNGRIGGVDLFA
ncbi:MAG: flagellar hook-length control protein FliK [Zoogloeaceae bacterium]|jgi:flagellar hook-length control protein FliK|nr:flagellar hook-length control protein FliK [Zoogloeaceae bacterium]